MDATQRVRAMLSFVQAADRGSFAAAARALGISSAAVGKNVAGLEGALGVRLMNRSTRSLKLTGEGEAFLARARDVITALDAAIDTVSAHRAEPAGRVRIATSNGLGRRYLLPLLSELLTLHPRLRPEIDLDDRRMDLVRDGYDLALRGGPLEDTSLICRRICTLVTVLVASPAYLARYGVPQRPDDLPQHRLIAVRFLNGVFSPWRLRTRDGHIEDHLPDPAALVVSDPQAAMDAAVLGLGIAQTGVHHAWPFLQAGQLKLVLARHHHSAERSLTLQYPHRALVAPRVRVTVEFLVQALSRDPALQVKLNQLSAFAA